MVNNVKTILDVSRWQGTIDWEKVKASGLVDGVMLKTVSTSSKLSKRADGLYVDPTFERNYAECKRVGLPVGAYYYTYAISHSGADAELAVLKTALEGKTLELPVCVDVEDNKLKKLGKQALTDLTAHALATIEKWGFYALLYTGLNFGNDRLYMGGAALSPYDVWVAAYRKEKPTPAWAFGMWQYTSTASVPGINGNADLSHAYRDYAAIIAKKNLNQLREE